MTSVTKLALTIKLFLLCLLLLLPVRSSIADGARFEVINNKIVTRVAGFDGRAITWRNSKNAKGVVVTIKAYIPREMKLWCVDFVLAYFHSDGREDRGRCRGISTVNSSPDDEGLWILGKTYGHVKAKPGVRYFKVLFPLENDVKRFRLTFAKAVTGNITANR